MVFEGFTGAFKVAWYSATILVLVSSGHTFYLQSCYTQAAEKLAKCQPWQAFRQDELSDCIDKSVYNEAEGKGISALWAHAGGNCQRYFSVLNPAFVDAVVIALPANVLAITFLTMHFLSGKPIKRLPELGAICVIFMLVSSGCGFKAVSISHGSLPPSVNSKYVKLSDLGTSFVIWQLLSSLASAAVVILLWSGKAFAGERIWLHVRRSSDDDDDNPSGSLAAPEAREGSHELETESEPQHPTDSAAEPENGDESPTIDDVSESAPIMPAQ